MNAVHPFGLGIQLLVALLGVDVCGVDFCLCNPCALRQNINLTRSRAALFPSNHPGSPCDEAAEDAVVDTGLRAHDD